MEVLKGNKIYDLILLFSIGFLAIHSMWLDNCFSMPIRSVIGG